MAFIDPYKNREYTLQEYARAMERGQEAKEGTSEEKNVLLGAVDTAVDLGGNVLEGAGRSIEGIFDMVAGVVGGVGGLISKDFQEGVQDVIEFDVTDWAGNEIFNRAHRMLTGRDIAEDSYLKDGGMIEQVLQGVGGMLPAVAVSLATSGAGAPAALQRTSQALSMATMATGAAGQATQEAYRDGAGYYQGLAYGAIRGGTEVATEKLFGGLDAGLFGKGFLPAVSKSVADTGVKRFVKGALQEGAEEMISELSDPLARSVYQGKEAYKKYLDPAFYGDVWDAGVAGTLTGAAFSGTVGRALSGGSLSEDLNAIEEQVTALENKKANLEATGKLTAEAEAAIDESIRENYRLAESVLKGAKEGKRRSALERSALGADFEADGSLKAEKSALLDAFAEGRRLSVSPAEGAEGENTAALDGRYVSHRVTGDRAVKALKNGGARALTRELSEAESKEYAKLRRAMRALDVASGNKLDYVLAEGMADKNAYFDPDTGVVVIGADTLTADAEGAAIKAWGQALVHEVTHTTEGTMGNAALAAQLSSIMGDDALYAELSRRGYFKGSAEEVKAHLESITGKVTGELTESEIEDLETFVSEGTAIMAEKILGDGHFIRRLVTEQGRVAEKVLVKLTELKESLSRMTSRDAKSLHRAVVKAEGLYLKAVEEAGYRFEGGKFVGSEEEEKVKYSRVIRDVIQKAIDNKGDIGEEYNQKRFSSVPRKLSEMVEVASAGKIDISGKHLALNGDDIWHEYQRHSNPEIEAGRRQIPLTQETMKEAIEAIYAPDIVECVFADGNNPSQRRSFAYSKKTADGHYVVVEVIGGRKNPNITPVMVIHVNQKKWDAWKDKTLGEMLYEHDKRLLDALDVPFNKKNRVTVAQFVSEETIANTPHSPQFNNSISQDGDSVKRNFSEGKVKESRKAKSQTSGNSEATEETPFEKAVRRMEEGKNNSETVENLDNENTPKAEIVKYETAMEGDVLPKPVLPFRKMLTDMLGKMIESDADYKILSDYAKSIDKLDVLQDRINELNMKRDELRDIQYNSPDARERSEAAKALQELYKVRAELEEEMAKGDREIARLREMAPIKNLMRQAEKKGKAKAEQKARERMESKETTEGKRLLEKKLRHLYLRLFDPTKKWHIPPEMRDEVNAALAQTNMSTKWVTKVAKLEAELDRLTKLKEKGVPNDKAIKEIEEELEAALAERESLSEQMAFGLRLFELFGLAKENAESVSRAFDTEIKEKLYEYAKIVGNTPIHEMTLEQVEAANKFYQSLITRIGFANQLFLDGKAEELQANGDKIMAEAQRAISPKFLKPKKSESKARAAGRKFIWEMLKPLTAIDLIGSKTLSRVFDGMMDGETTFAIETERAAKYARSAFRKYHFNDWDLSKRTAFKTANGKEMRLTVGEMISLYCLYKRPAAYKNLTEGGVKYPSNATDKSKGKPEKRLNDTSRYVWDDETIDLVVKALTTEQRAFADEMQQYLADMGALGNEIALQMWGIELFNDPNYFPKEVDESGIDSQTGRTGDPKLTNQSFTNRVNEKGATNPLILRDFMDVWVNHVNSMNMFYAFAIPTENMNKVLNYRITAERDPDTGEWAGDAVKKLQADDLSVKAVLKSQYGDDSVKYIERLLRDINGGARADNAASLLDRGLTAFKRASTLLSLSTIIQQPTSVARAMAYINVKYFAGDKVLKGKHREKWRAVMEAAPVAVTKDMGGYDTGVGSRTQDYLKSKEYETLGEKFGGFFKDGDYRAEVFGRGAAFADEVAWISIYEACVREQADKLKVSVDSKPAMMMGAKRFAEVIRRTQVYDSTLTRTEIMRSKDTGAKMVTAFMAEPSTVVNMMIDGIVRVSRGDWAFMGKTVGAVTAAIILNSILVSLVYAMRDDDEDQNYGEKYLESLLWELSEGVNPAEYFPYLRDIMSLVKGYDVERSDMTLFAQLIRNVQSITSERKTPYEKVVGVAGAVSSFFGLPVKNVERDARGMLNTVVGSIRKDPEEDIPDAVRREMNRLVINGMDVLPRGVGDVITYEGQSVKLTAKQKAQFRKVYGEANEAVSRMVSMKLYTGADDEAKAKAIKRLYGIYYNRAIEDLLGVDIENKNVLMSRAVDPAQLAIVSAVCAGLAADVGKDGKTITGSKKAKVISYLSALNLKAAQKHLILGYLGYKNTQGEEKVRAYLAGLGLGREEVKELLEIGGY
ncbi:MAG: hypothetical protein E7645_00935 [Ruminococcaceae bacterium]|nr:hypothetical protein [Oscillospiraceae bacterium]